MNGNKHNYDCKSIQSGILHIGVGNFHRAHQAFYIDRLLNDQDQLGWGICGVCLLPSDENMVRKLRAQQLRYTLTVCGRDGQNVMHRIQSICELLWAVEDPQSVISKIADPAIKIITLTITEGGYQIDRSTQELMLDNESLQKDLQNPKSPTTVFGFIAEGLRQRKKAGASGVTILSCDNLQHNGEVAKKAFTTFIHAQDAELGAWVDRQVSFPNSMVDRITPMTTAADVIRLNSQQGLDDQVPVYCEDFIQWVIEDNFIAGRPALERVGVQFTDDVSAFENMKLSLLNASHTLLAYPSFLKGYRKVDIALQDPKIYRFIKDFMELDVTPHVPAPAGTDLNAYKQTLLERFANRAVSDQVSRLCADGISKFPVYIVPTIIKMLASGQDLTRIALLLASYRHYLHYKTDDHHTSYEINEPWLTIADQQKLDSVNPLEFLSLSIFTNLQLHLVDEFVDLYLTFSDRIQQEGMAVALNDYHNSQQGSAAQTDLLY